MAETSFVVFCPECNMLVKAKAVAEGHGSPFHEDTVALLDDVDKPYRCDHYSVCLCPDCEQPFLVKESLYGVAGEFETVTDQTVLCTQASQSCSPKRCPTASRWPTIRRRNV